MLRRSALRLAEQGTQGYSSAASYSTKLEPKTKVTRGISFSYNKDAEKIAAMKTTTAQAGIVRIRDTVQQHDPRPAVVDSLLLDMPTKVSEHDASEKKEEIAARYKDQIFPMSRVNWTNFTPDYSKKHRKMSPKQIRESELATERWRMMWWLLFWGLVGANITHYFLGPEDEILPVLTGDEVPLK